METNIIKIAKPDFLKQFKKENQQKQGEVVAKILEETTIEYLQQITKLEELKELLKKLENTVHELNEKIPDIEPLLKDFTKMFKTLYNISKAIGNEDL